MTKRVTLSAVAAALTLAACNSGNGPSPVPVASSNIATPSPSATAAATSSSAPVMVIASSTPGITPTAVTNVATPSVAPTGIAALDTTALLPVPSSLSNILTYSYQCLSQGNTYTGTETITPATILNGVQTYRLDSNLPISSTLAFKSSLIIGLDSNANTIAYGSYDLSTTPAVFKATQPTIVFNPTASQGTIFTTLSATGTSTNTQFIGTTSVTTPLQTFSPAYHYQTISGTFQQDLYFSIGLGIIENSVTNGTNASSCLLAQAPSSF